MKTDKDKIQELLETISRLNSKLEKAKEDQKMLLNFIDKTMDNFNRVTYSLLTKTVTNS